MDVVSPAAPERPSPRERLLQAADRLFYEEGVHSVGVDRILRDADVARASLYSTYGSKDQLLRAYLQNRSHGWQALVAEALPTRWDTARDRIVGIFEMLTEWFAAPGYHGCPFINASAEAGSNLAIQDVRDDHRAWVRAVFTGLARDAGRFAGVDLAVAIRVGIDVRDGLRRGICRRHSEDDGRVWRVSGDRRGHLVIRGRVAAVAPAQPGRAGGIPEVARGVDLDHRDHRRGGEPGYQPLVALGAPPPGLPALTHHPGQPG